MKKKHFIKMVLYISISLFFASTTYAIEKGPCEEPKDVCCEEAQGPFAFSYPKDVGLSCPRNFNLHAEFLWMKPTENGLEYAISQTQVTNSNQFPLGTGKVKGFSRDSDEWDWRPGLRIGLGHLGMHDSWSFDVNWTYIRIKSDSAFSVGKPTTLLALYIPPAGVDEQTISARWTGDYNTFDLMLGKPYHVSRYFVSNPMFGLRAAWIDQDFHARYFPIDGPGGVNRKFNAFVKNDFWGVGLRGSYEAEFLLGAAWSIYGKAAAALLFGKFDLSQNHDSPIGYNVEYTFYRVKPNAELATGFSWSKFFNKNQYLVTLKAGYEFHHWWDQYQARRFFDTDPTANDTTSRGDLSFNGFMFGLNIDF